MSLRWLKTIAGDAPLPDDILEQNLLVSFAEAHHVVGQMAVVWQDKTDGKLKDILENGKLRTGFDHCMLAFEMNRLERALLGSEIKPILLKGGAYVALGLKAGQGRRVADIDILVGEHELEVVEKALLYAGWAFDTATANTYDTAYYRQHMHELPPLRHTKRRTVADVHHRLLPRTARIKIDFQKMVDAAVDVPGQAFRVFGPVDRFIHSAIHSFADGSFDTPARSLLELHYLFQELAPAEKVGLAGRAQELGAAMPVGTALWALATLFENKSAADLLQNSRLKRANFLVLMALKGKLEHIDAARWAKSILYVRSHFLRMPYHKLAAHLAKKLIRRVRTPASVEAQKNN